MQNTFNLLAISPQGHLHLLITPNQDVCHTQVLSDPHIISAFKDNPSQGLLSLAAMQPSETGSPVVIYWREFATTYLQLLCQLPMDEIHSPHAIPIPNDLETLLLNLPPMPGAEYCTTETLAHIWQNFDNWIREQIQEYEDGVKGFLAQHLPLWQSVGRVCFHLAENKNDPNYPFAFLATYAPRLNHSSASKATRIQYQPLNKALQQYAGDNDKKALTRLLQPVYAASKRCAWVRELVESHDIYHPLAWTPKEAYALLNSVPELEESGVLVRLPNWWKKRPKARVQVTIGNKQQSSFNSDTLLDFDVKIAVGDEPLTREELAAIYAAEDGLISLRGQWIEVDNEKLQQALTHWQTVKSEVADGELTFIEGMRLLAGAQSDLSADDEITSQDWAFVEAGSWLRDKLDGLRQPDTLATNEPGELLQATLRPYQQIGVNWLHFLSELGIGACLADDMGLGKTIQILSLLLVQKRQAKQSMSPSLLILPASLLSNWKSEIERFAPSLTAIYLHTSEIARDTFDQLATDPQTHLQNIDLVLTTYGTLLRQPWLQEYHWRLVILDEAQAIKNPSTRQTKAVKSLNATARIALTGTPIENRLGDLWSLFDFLCPGLLGSSTRFKAFIKDLEENEHNPYAPLRRLVQPYILRRLKTDKRIISDLPDKTEVIKWCGLSKEQATLYMQAVNALKKSLESEEEGIKRRGLVLSYLMQFKQICNHPSQRLADGDYAIARSGKLAQLRDICEEIASRQEKVLIFTQFREITSPLETVVANVFGQRGLILHGGTPVKQRKGLVEQFQQEQGPPFFVLSLKAGGTGLNLTAASHVIHFDRWWNPAVENQATDRAFRIGQHKNVLVHKFVCRGTIEEKINQMITEKTQLADGVLESGGATMLTELDDDALIDLVTLDVEKALF